MKRKQETSFTSFQDYLQLFKELSLEEVKEKYLKYKKIYIQEALTAIFKESMAKEWFKEKYHPTQSERFITQSKQRKQDSLQEFKPKHISFDEKTAVLDLLQNPTTRSIFFKTQASYEEILPSVQIPGFKYLELTDADNRLGWVVLEDGVDMQFALASLQDMQIQSGTERPIQFQYSGGISIQTKSITGRANEPAQLQKDLDAIKELAVFLDTEAEISGVPILESFIKENFIESDEELVKKSLDLYIYYLNQVHYFDYYTGIESYCPEDHVRRGHFPLRREFDERESMPFWLESLDYKDKINYEPVQVVETQETKVLSLYVRKESEQKYRCIECQKLFRGEDFCLKHLRTKHPNLIEHVKGEVEYFNLFCKRVNFDPSLNEKRPERKVHDNRYTSDRHQSDRSYDRNDRGYDRRPSKRRDVYGREQKSRYNDVDAVPQTNIVLNYD